MALTFPLPLAAFRDTLGVASMSVPTCPSVNEESRTTGGDVIRSNAGAALWQGDIALIPTDHAGGREVQVMLDLLTREGASFLMQPHGYTKPPLGDATVTLGGVAQNNRDVTLLGLPRGYELHRGDFLSWTYASNPVRYGFHQVVTGGAANDSGRLVVEVGPIVRPGWAAGAIVRVGAPRFKAVLRRSSPGRAEGLITSGITFSYLQTLR